MSTGSTTGCPVCGSLGKTVPLIDRTWALGLRGTGVLEGCRACGAAHLRNGCGVAAGPAYGAAYFGSYEVFRTGSRQNRARRMEFLRRLLELSARAPGRELLDVGVGNGDFLIMARDQGWRCRGLDVTDFAGQRLRLSGVPLDVTNPASFLKARPGAFHVIHMNHSLEHMPDPREVVKAAYYALARGGLLYAEVPNEFASLRFAIMERLGRKRERGSLFGRSVPLPFPSPHRIFFTLRSLRTLAEGAGFDRVTVDARRRSDLVVTDAAGAVDLLGRFMNLGPFLSLRAVKGGSGNSSG